MSLLALLVLLVLVAIATLPNHRATAQQVTARLFLPFVAGGHAAMRGAASCGPANVDWCYSYYPPDTVDDTHNYEVVPLVSARLMTMAGNPPLRLGASQYVMFFNEPDNADPQSGDGLTPAQASVLFHQWAAQLPGAKIICCGTYYTPAWMDSFLVACACLAQLTGISFHDYAELWVSPNATEAQKLANWQAQAQTWVNWIHAHNGPYPTRQLEAWCSECSWSPCCEPDMATAEHHMQLLCAALPALKLTRAAWYIGSPQAGNIALTDGAGLTPLGHLWGSC